MKQLLILGLIGLLLVASGCAVIRKPPSSAPGIDNSDAWQQRQETLADLDHWSLQGRVATGQLLGWTGNLSWRERDDYFDVRLAGPLGAGGMRANGTLDQVTIHTDDGRRLVTSDPDALLEKTLGWSFPLAPLRYWARGLPAPGDYRQISVNAKGQLTSLRQAGWKLSYLEYTRPPGAPASLPRRIVLDNGQTRIRLVVDRWFDLPSTNAGARTSAASDSAMPAE